MSDNLVVRVALNNSNFKQGIAALNRDLKNVNSKFKESMSEVGKYGSAVDKLKANKDRLTASIRSQSQIVDMHKNKLKESQRSLLEAKKAQNDLRNKMKETEQAYNSTRGNIGKLTSEQKKLKQAMDTVKQSHTANTQKVKELKQAYMDSKQSIGANAQETIKLKQAYEQARNSAKQNKNELKNLRTAYSQNRTELTQNKTKLKELENTQKQLSAEYKRSETSVRKHAAAVQNNQNFLSQAKAKLNGFKNELKSVTAELERSTGKINVMSQKLQTLGAKMSTFGQKMTSMGRSATMAFTLPVALLGGKAVRSAMEFESAMTGVAKTTDLTKAEFKNLERGILDMTSKMPKTGVEIANIAESAGQLGIAKQNILDFSKVMGQLSDTTNLSSEDAAMNLAKFANITRMSQGDFDRLGSTIVNLGNNMATTERDIVEMSMRLAGAGTQVGMSEAQIVSFSAALSSVGIEAEMGGSAFSKVMVNMQASVETGGEKLSQFAKVAGMSAKEFQQAFKEDAAGAIVKFIEGLGNAEKQGKSAIGILNDMGITEVRLRDTLLRAAGASDLFSESLELGESAWKENIALTKEAEMRYKDTREQIKIAMNDVKKSMIEIGRTIMPTVLTAVRSLAKLTQAFTSLPSPVQKATVGFLGFAITLPPLMWGIGSITNAFGLLAKGIGKALPVITNITKMKALAATATIKFGSALAFLGSPAGIAVLALAGVATAAVVVGKSMKEKAIPPVQRFGKEISKSTQEAVGSFMDLEQNADTSLKKLAWSGQVVTEQLKTSITSNISKMSKQVSEELDKQEDKTTKTFQDMFSKNGKMTEKELNKNVELIEKSYEKRKEKVKNGENKINEIMKKASNEKRALTQSEVTTIQTVKKEMLENGVKVLTKSEAEQKVIIERLRNNTSKISAQQASDIVKNSKKQRDGVKKEAESQYNEQLKLAAQLREMGGKEYEKLADKVVSEAKRQKEGTIKEADQQHKEIIKKAKEQAKDQADNIDWTTGEVKSKGQVLKEELAKPWKEGFEKVGKEWEKLWANPKGDTDAFLTEQLGKLQQGIDKFVGGAGKFFGELSKPWKEGFSKISGEWGKLKDQCSKGWNDFTSWLSSLPGQLKQAMSKLAQPLKEGFGNISINWDKLKGQFGKGFETLKSGISSGIDKVKSSITEKWKTIQDAFSFDSISAKVKSGVDSIIKWFSELPGKLLEKGKESMQGFIDGLLGKEPEVANASKRTADGATKGTTGTNTKMKAEGSKAGQGFASGILSKLGLTTSNSKQHSNKATAGVKTAKSGMQSAGNNAGQGFASGILSKLGLTTANSKKHSINAVKQVQNAKNGMRSAGGDAGQGFANGILSKVGSVVNAAKSMAQKALSAVKSAIKSNSPSKITTGFGNDFGDGFANGIIAKISRVMSASKMLAKSAIDKLDVEKTMKDYGAFAVDSLIKGIGTNKSKLEQELESINALIEEKTSKIDSKWDPYTEKLKKKLLELEVEEAKALFGKSEKEKENIQKKFEDKKKNIQEEINLREKQKELELKIIDEQYGEEKRKREEELKKKENYYKKLDDLISKMVDAYKNYYQQIFDKEDALIKTQLENLDKWKEESLKNINSVYDAKISAIDDELKALEKAKQEEDREKVDAEELKEIENVKQAIKYEHDSENKAQLEKELENLLKQREERLKNQALEDKKLALNEYKSELEEKRKNELANIEDIYQHEKLTLEERQKNLKEFYDEKTKEANLQAEAERLIASQNQEAIVGLLKDYAPEYRTAGELLGDKLLEGFNPALEALAENIRRITAMINAEVRKPDLLLSGSSAQQKTVINNTKSYNMTSNSYGGNSNAREMETAFRKLAFLG